MRAKFLLIAAALSTAAVSMTPAYAQDTPSSRAQAEIQAAWQAAAKSGTFGPAQIRLLDQATLNITDDEVFIPAAEANRIMAALGIRRHLSASDS